MMFRNYLLIILRGLAKQKGLAFINVIGLSTGMACFTLGLLYAVNEWTFDRFHEKSDRLFRLYERREAMGGNAAKQHTFMPMLLGPAIQDALPNIEKAIRLREPWGEDYIRVNGQVSRSGIVFADAGIFDVFSFPFVSGDPATALRDVRSVVLTEKTALRLFGQTNPVGKQVDIKVESDFEPFVVTGIAKDPPANSTIQFEVLCSFERFTQTEVAKEFGGHWGNLSFQVFLLLRPGVAPTDLREGLQAFRRLHYPREEQALRQSGEWTAAGAPVRYGLQPLRGWHTDTALESSFVPPVNGENIWTLLAIAGCVLLIACINFTVLAIGRSAGRAREVGVRKVLGGSKTQLARQFLLEAFVLCLTATVLSWVLAQALLPSFNRLAEKNLTLSFSYYPELWLWVAAVPMLTALLAGGYPALVLSAFRPVEVLKNKIRLGGSNLFTRSLVTLQFVLSSGLIISTLVMLRQVHFMQSKNPGFDKENVITVNAENVAGDKIYPLFRQRLLQRAGIAGVTASSLGLGEGMGYSRTSWETAEGVEKSAYLYRVDAAYFEVLGLQLLAGRLFDPAITTDTSAAVVVNEAFVQDFGWTPETALRQPLTGFTRGNITPVIIGVVKNIHFRSFHEPVKPQLFHQFSEWGTSKFFVRLKPGDPAPALAAMQEAWSALAPGLPLEYSFLDEDLNRFYKTEARWSNIISWAGGVSIFLACLGLLGLAALAMANRVKEIGIRKVLGATVAGLVGLLTRDFLKLVALSLLLAAPLAWMAMTRWLDHFAFRVNIGWEVFVATGAIAVASAFLAIGVQSVKTALANPVDSLRSE